MSKLKAHREKLNLTQKELAEKTHLSLRTIQRIEAGQEPKGYTLKTLATALEVDAQALLSSSKETEVPSGSINTWINLAALPLIFFPPLNILVPLAIMFAKKAFNEVSKQVITLQIIWTLAMVVLVVASALIRNAYALSDSIPPTTLATLMLANLFIILRNAYEIAKSGSLYITLNFSLI